MFEEDFDTTEENVTEAAADTISEEMEAMEAETSAELVVENAEVLEDQAASEDDFFAENAAPEVPAVDPTHVVTLIPSSSDNKYVEVEGPMPMIELIGKSRLQFEGDFTCFLNGAEISLNTLVPGGSSVVIVGKVKGGAL